MKKILLIVIIIGIGFTLFYALFLRKGESPPPDDGESFPLAPDNGLPPSNYEQYEKIAIKTSEGIVVVNNFFSNAIQQSPSSFALKETEEYSVMYDARPPSFHIVIAREPRDQQRMAAESALLNILGISEADACKLNVSVRAPRFLIGMPAATRDYHLSFCPDGIPFPK